MSSLPKELSCLNALKKFSFEKTFEVKIGESVMVFRVLKTEDQMKILNKTMDKANILGDQASFVFELRLNTLAYSIKSVDGEEFPNPETIIYDEDSQPQGTFLDKIKEEILEWNEWIYNYISIKVREQQKILYDEVKETYGLSFDDIPINSPFDYGAELEKMQKDEEEIIKKATMVGDSSTEASPTYSPENVTPNDVTQSLDHQQSQMATPVLSEPQISRPSEEVTRTDMNPLPSQEEYMKSRSPQNSGGIVGSKPVSVDVVKSNPEAYAEHMANISRPPKIKK